MSAWPGYCGVLNADAGSAGAIIDRTELACKAERHHENRFDIPHSTLLDKMVREYAVPYSCSLFVICAAQWCANPENHKLAFTCSGLKNVAVSAVPVCRRQRITPLPLLHLARGVNIDRKQCSNLLEMVDICPYDAYEKVGKEMTSAGTGRSAVTR